MSPWRPDHIEVRLGGIDTQYLWQHGGTLESWSVPLAESAAMPVDWSDALARAAADLSTRGVRPGTRATLVLPGSIVRFQIVPWNESFITHSARSAYVRECFVEAYGPISRDWVLVASDARFGSNALAAGLAPTLLVAFDNWARELGIRITSLQPALMAGFNRALGRLKRATFWFVFNEDDRYTLLLIDQGAPVYIRSVRHAEASLEILLERAWQTIGREDGPCPVYWVDHAGHSAPAKHLGRWIVSEVFGADRGAPARLPRLSAAGAAR